MQRDDDDKLSGSITDVAAAVWLKEAFSLKKNPFCRSVLRAFKPHSVHYLTLKLGEATCKGASEAEIDHIIKLIREFEPKRRTRIDATRPSRPRGRPSDVTNEDIEFIVSTKLPEAFTSPRYQTWLDNRDNLRRGDRSALLYMFECLYKHEGKSELNARSNAAEIADRIQDRIASKRRRRPIR